MQNAKQAYCKTFSDDHVQVAEKHGDCQIVLMRRIDLQRKRLNWRMSINKEIAEKHHECPHLPVSTCIM